MGEDFFGGSVYDSDLARLLVDSVRIAGGHEDEVLGNPANLVSERTLSFSHDLSDETLKSTCVELVEQDPDSRSRTLFEMILLSFLCFSLFLSSSKS
jgi:hypothetical protein